MLGLRFNVLEKTKQLEVSTSADSGLTVKADVCLSFPKYSALLYSKHNEIYTLEKRRLANHIGSAKIEFFSNLGLARACVF